jgi:hypothetical protein
MKKLLLIAALVLVAAFGVKAQNPNRDNPSRVPTDSVSIMLRHLANTNAEMQYINDNLRLHSQLSIGSFAFMGVSALCFYQMANLEVPTSHSGMVQYNKDIKSLKTIGIVTGIIGGVGFICSYIPIWTKKIKVDNRGLVINIGGNNGTR